MPSSFTTAAIDLGATSGRVILGHWKGDSLTLEEVHRFPNDLQSLGDHDYWNLPGLFNEIVTGLRKGLSAYPDLASCGVNTWGVDHVLLDANGRLVFPAHAYRDQRTLPFQKKLQGEALEKIYALTGIAVQPFNTSFQLQEVFSSYPSLREMIRKILFLPGYFTYLLSGKATSDLSIASTSQLLDLHGTDFHPEALEHFGIPAGILPTPEKAGRKLGPIQREDLASVEVILAPGHDTGAAFEAMPSKAGQRDLYISCGTWSLSGFVSDTPMASPEALARGISNERTGDGRYRPLRNLLGLWLLEQTLPHLGKKPETDREWDELISAAEKEPVPREVLDIEDQRFFNPRNMKEAIDQQLTERQLPIPSTTAGYVRLIIESLAAGQATVAKSFEEMTGQTFDRILIVGGGSRNRLLCQRTADHSGHPVISYELEGTATGNIGCQLVSLGAFPDSASFRQALSRQLKGQKYSPSAKSE